MRRRAAQHDRDGVWLSTFIRNASAIIKRRGVFLSCTRRERGTLGWYALPPMRRTHPQVTHAGLQGEACQNTNLAQDLPVPRVRLARLAPKGRVIEAASYAADDHQRVGYPANNNVARAVCDRKAQPSRPDCRFRTAAIALRLIHRHVFNPLVDQLYAEL